VIRNSRRVFALTVAGAVAFAPVMSGCAAGRTPQTAMPTQLTEGINVTVPQRAKKPEIDIRNMFVLGPAAGTAAAPGSSVPLYATFINQVQGRPDRLVSVSSPDITGAQIAGNAVTLPAATAQGGQAVRLFTQPGQTPQVVLQGIRTRLFGGEYIELTLRFERAGSITVPVPVVPAQGEFASYSPVPTASPASSPTQSGRPAATTSPTVGDTATPGATETPVPSPTVPSASPS